MISYLTKYKQISINHISKSIKFIQTAYIYSDMFSYNLNLIFEIEYSGLGMNKHIILKIKLFTPFWNSGNLKSNNHGSYLWFFDN